MSAEPLPDLTAIRALCEAAMGPGDFTREEARQLGAAAMILVERREKNRSGRAASPPTTDDGKLIAAACVALGKPRGRKLKHGELAEKLGLGRGNQAMLSPSTLARHKLSDDHKAMLSAWIAGGS